MKLHIGVDSQSGLAHRAVVTPANLHEKHPLPDLLHGNEQRAYGDSAYASQKKLIQGKAPRAKDFTNQRTRRAGGSVNEVQRGKEPQQVKDSGSAGAYFWPGQAAVGLCQGALPWFAEECHAGVHARGAGQFLSQPTKVDGTGASMRAPKGLDGPCIRPQQESRNEAVHASFRPLRSIRRPSRHFDGAYSA